MNLTEFVTTVQAHLWLVILVVCSILGLSGGYRAAYIHLRITGTPPRKAKVIGIVGGGGFYVVVVAVALTALGYIRPAMAVGTMAGLLCLEVVMWLIAIRKYRVEPR